MLPRPDSQTTFPDDLPDEAGCKGEGPRQAPVAARAEPLE